MSSERRESARGALAVACGAAVFATAMVFLGGDGASTHELAEQALNMFLLGVLAIVAVVRLLAIVESRRH